MRSMREIFCWGLSQKWWEMSIVVLEGNLPPHFGELISKKASALSICEL